MQFSSYVIKDQIIRGKLRTPKCTRKFYRGQFSLNVTYSRWFLARRFFYLQDGSDMFLRNVGSHKIYTAPHPRKGHSS
jgi:hypothetical protein